MGRNKDKGDLCRDFFDDIDMAKDGWIKYRVHPYAKAYIAAYASYKKGLDDYKKYLEAKEEMFMAVCLLAGGSILAFAPVAKMISSGGKSARMAAQKRFYKVTRVLSENGVLSNMGMNRAEAYKVIKGITYGSGTWVQKLAEPKIKAHLTKALKVSTMEGAAPSPTGSDEPPSELSYMIDLWGAVLTMSTQLKSTAQMLRDTNDISDAEAAETIAAIYANSPFFQKAPHKWVGDHALATRGKVVTDLHPQITSYVKNSMEQVMWSRWTLFLKKKHYDEIEGYDSWTYRGGGDRYYRDPPEFIRNYVKKSCFMLMPKKGEHACKHALAYLRRQAAQQTKHMGLAA